MKQYGAIEETFYFWFAGNDTSGSGGDGASPAADVRLAGAAVDAIPILSPTPTLLTHANYPAGCYELAVAATAANGFAANNTYAVFCTLAIDSQNPTGFIGSVDLKPILANAKQLGGTNQTGRDIGANVLLSSGTGAGQLDFTSGVVKSNLAQILGTVLTETAGYIAAGFKKLFNIATPVLTMDSVNQSADNNTILAHADYGNAKLARTGADSDTLETLSDQVDGCNTTTPPTVGAIRTEMEGAGTKLTNTLGDTNELQTNQGNWLTAIGFNTVIPDAAGTAATPAEVATALANIHLDHLLAADYDPANKPGIATALLNELIESDGGVSRYTANALEQAPSAGTNPNVLVDTTIASVIDQTHFVLTAGSNDNDAYKDQAIAIYDASDNDYPSVRVCDGYVGATKTITLDSAPDFTIVSGDGCKAFVTAPGTTAPTVGQIRTEMEGAGYKLALIEADTDELQGNQDNWTTATGFNTVVPDAAGVAPTAAEIKTEIEQAGSKLTLALIDTNELQINQGNWLTATGFNTTVPDVAGTAASLHTATNNKIDTNKIELDGLQGTDGKCAISTDAQDLSGTFDVNTKTATATALDLILKDSTFVFAIADAVWDEILTGTTHNIPNSAGRRVREIGAFAIESGTAQAGTLGSITLAATANGSNGIFNRNLIVLTDNTGKGQTRTIIDYNAITKEVIIDRDWRVIPDNTTAYQIVPDDTPLTVDHGMAQDGTSTTIKIREYASSVNNAYWCNIIGIIAGKGRGQARLVGSYNGTSKIITICGEDWVEIPDTTSVYVMMPYGTTCTACLTDSALALINTEVDNVLNTAIPGSPTVDSINQRVKAIDDLIQANGSGDLAVMKTKTDNLPSGIAKNVALSSFTFCMVLTSDHVSAATGKTIIAQISKDGSAFAGSSNSVSEIGNGLYKIDLIQAEMNADIVALKFTETDCDQRVVVVYTS